MELPVYLSTGAFIGRKNGRNWRLVLEYASQLACDGFEFLFFEDFYPNIDEILRQYRASGISFPVIHAEKSVGDRLDGSPEGLKASLACFRINCAAGAELGCKKVVLHGWGYPYSDSDPSWTCGVIPRYMETAREAGLELVVENVVCRYGSPLKLLERLHTAYPELHFLLDTRHAQFHRELPAILDSPVMGNVRHIHLADFHGGYMDWDHRSAGLPLGEGDMDWQMFFGRLRSMGYNGTVTIEASAILEAGVDVEAQNRNLRFVKDGLRG